MIGIGCLVGVTFLVARKYDSQEHLRRSKLFWCMVP